jgi:hypothetical protein
VKTSRALARLPIPTIFACAEDVRNVGLAEEREQVMFAHYRTGCPTGSSSSSWLAAIGVRSFSIHGDARKISPYISATPGVLLSPGRSGILADTFDDEADAFRSFVSMIKSHRAKVMDRATLLALCVMLSAQL